MSPLSTQMQEWDTSHAAFARGVPYHKFKAQRASAPTSWIPEHAGPGFWLIAGYADALAAYSNTTLSSEGGLMLGMHHRADPAAGKMLVATDGPRHDSLRRLMQRAFTATAVGR